MSLEDRIARLPDADAPLPPRKKPVKGDHERIAELFKKGMNDHAIATKLGYANPDVVRAIRSKLGLKKKRTHIDIKQLERLHYRGLSAKEIADELGYSESYIRRLVWQYHLRD